MSGDPRYPPKKKKEKEKESEKAPEAKKAGPFTVNMTSDAKQAYEDLPGNVKTSVDEVVDRLRAWPEVSGVRSLWGKGYAANKFRMKTWDWRLEFIVDPKANTITVVRIGHRDTFYDEYH